MKKILQKAGILFLIFIAASVVYFISARNTMEKESAVYTAMEEPTLPVIYTNYNGRDINCLRGYVQDMGNQAARDNISVLPENRELTLHIAEYGNTITKISYEVRNLSMDRLIERTDIEEWNSQDGITTATLPIQNLLTKNETYMLTLFVDIGEKSLHYYTRIMWADNTYASDMLNLAEEFTRKSLDYEQAKDLTTYLETSNTEDNSNLAHVTIKSSFDHLTWDGLEVAMEGQPEITLQEFDGIMAHIQVKYKVRMENGTESGSIVNAEDNFTMKWNEKRIYLMNYERNADELFTGESEFYSGKRILLGITNDKKTRSMKSPDSRYLVFKTNENLWSYDQKDRESVCIFTFHSQTDDGVRSGYDKHGVKILSVKEDGNVDFLVYGYMNRGKYEGQMGVVYYTYQKESDTVQEKFFIPSAQVFEKIEEDINRLSYLTPNEMMYLMLNGTVYGIDLMSNESLVVARGLAQGSYAVSPDGSRFAWQEAGELYHASMVHVMDFNTSQKQEIAGESGDYVRVLGFVGSDLIYGLEHEDDTWMADGRLKDYPLYAMYIVDSQMNVQSEYKRDGIWITDIVVEEGRIHLKRLAKLSQNEYVYQENDTIVCNQKVEEDELEGIGWFASNDKGRVYFVQADSDIAASRVKTSAPEAFSYEYTSILDLESMASSSSDASLIFYAYGGGHYLGSSRNFQTAVSMAYDKMGFVTDSNQRVLWDRVNRQNIRNIREPLEEAAKITRHLGNFTGSKEYEQGLILIDAQGCILNQVLYFIDKGIPVVAYISSNEYLLLSGYDQYNISLYNPQTQESWKMGLGDASEYFASLNNDFVCALSME